MTNHKEIVLILEKIRKIKKQIFIKWPKIGHLSLKNKSSRKKQYDTLDFLWLNIFLSALKYITIREKINFLKDLKSTSHEKHLILLYKFIGINNFTTKIPSIGFFCDYVKYFNPDELEKILNDSLISLGEIKDLSTGFALFSIDGKDIRNSHNNSNTNKKSVNVVVNRTLYQSFIVDHEASWIKQKLCDFIEKTFNNFNIPNSKNVFIGDGLYHNNKIRRFFSNNNFLAILPLMNMTKQFKNRVNTAKNINIEQKNSITDISHEKSNKCIIREEVVLIPIKTKLYKEINNWNYVMEIKTTTTNIKTNIINIKNRQFITNIDLPNTLNTLKILRQLIKQHWQVETFHQYKDFNLLEDKYYKKKEKASYKSIIANFSFILQQSCSINNKNNIDSLKTKILLLLGFLFFFLTEQHYLNLDSKLKIVYL